MTVSFIRWSSARNASSAAPACSVPQAVALGLEEVGRPGRPGVGQPVGAGDRRHEPVDGELVEDRLDVIGRDEDRIGDALQRREALDRDRSEAVVGRDLANRRSGRVDGLAAARGSSPIGMPSSSRPAEQRPRLRHHRRGRRDRPLEDLAGAAVDRDHVACPQRVDRRP